MRLLRMAILPLTLTLAGVLGCATYRASEPPPSGPAEANGEPFDPAGIGTLEARTPRGDPAAVALRRVHVAATQRGDMVEIEATHTFVSDSQAVLEGTFRFPMPDGALITGLAMIIDGKLMEGELVEREKARKVFEEIVDSMQDPALLEWEHGTVFKMRVFPINPHEDKIVTVRYLAPLRRRGDKFEFVQAARAVAGDTSVRELRIDFEGKQVFSEANVEAGRVLTFPARHVSALLREKRADGVYSLVRVEPDWSRVPAPTPSASKNWFVVVDTSRSALEEQPRQLEALGVLLEALPRGARFQVLTSDLDTQPSPGGLSLPNPESVAQAIAFVKSVPPDGASDLGRALQVVAELVRDVQDGAVLYLGDCEPTRGITSAEDLATLMQQRLPGVPVYPLLFGASHNDDVAGELAQRSGGRRARIRRREDLHAFAKTLTAGVAVLNQIEVTSEPNVEMLAYGPLSIEKGQPLLLLIKGPVGSDPVKGLAVNAKVQGRTLNLLPSDKVQDSGGLARRFGAALVRKLEKTGGAPGEIVSTSLAYGVMSKLTSFLVLESEEAYARYAIERRNGPTGEAPRVTGQNLESTTGADISAGRIQPGDPEIYVDAERDALSVKVEFPFGEIKNAHFDPEARGGRGAWMVRFLVPCDTPEGEYRALAHIQHRDGSLTTRQVRYTVDSTGPELDVNLAASARRRNMVVVTVNEPVPGPTSDLKRVELMTPGGRVVQLSAMRWGMFRAFVPAEELRGGKLRIVGFDQALNHRVKELELP